MLTLSSSQFVLVFGRRHDEPFHALWRPASKKRQGTKSREVGNGLVHFKNLNDGYRAIGEAVIMLTRSLKQFRLDNIEVCCGLQKLDRAMMLQGCRKADRAEVVERDRFATPNSLKSHRQRNLLSPVSNTCARTPKLCMPSRPIHPSKNYYAALKSRTAAKSP